MHEEETFLHCWSPLAFITGEFEFEWIGGCGAGSVGGKSFEIHRVAPLVNLRLSNPCEGEQPVECFAIDGIRSRRLRNAVLELGDGVVLVEELRDAGSVRLIGKVADFGP